MTEGRLLEMIREMAIEFARVTGTTPTREQVQTVELHIRRTCAGEQVYVSAHPKERVRQMAEAAQKDSRKLAALAGISERQARRVLRGK